MIGIAISTASGVSVSGDPSPLMSMIGPVAAAIAAGAVGVVTRPLIVRSGRTDLGTPRAMSDASEPLSRQRVRRRGAVAAAALVIAVVAGPVALGFVAAAFLLVRGSGPIRAARRRRDEIARALPDAMDLLVLSVRAGLTPFQAVCDLATSGESVVGDAFAEVVRRTERGQPFADALGALPAQLGAPAGGLADVIATSDRHGLPLGPTLDQLTVEVRATRRRLDQAEARKLPVRLSFPLVVCTLPSFVLLAIAPAVIAALSSLGGTAW
jgi:Flp pilus assembly protein TadB